MATILDALKGINAYPVPPHTLNSIAEVRGLELTDTTTRDILTGKQFLLAKADILMWLSKAPNISQGGQSYSFSEEDRKMFRAEAKSLYADCGEDKTAILPKFGYKGNRL